MVDILYYKTIADYWVIEIHRYCNSAFHRTVRISTSTFFTETMIKLASNGICQGERK